ncbi:MAG: glycosyltransferase family 2 protein [Acidobacteria bacterium]|nr:glycosyltransferase family 2 protein [Acidobacteriota bacterium]
MDRRVRDTTIQANRSSHRGVALSVVFPVYNEALRIPSTLRHVLEYLDQGRSNYEILVVDDGSTDDTAAIVEKVGQETSTVRLLRNPGNCGKGYAIRNGMLQARGEVLLFSDADLSTPIAELDRLLEPLQSGYDVAIGSRALRPEWIHPRQSLLREAAGRTFNLCVRAVTSLNFQDTQCGFKAFRRQAAQAIFSRQQVPGFGFDVEVLYLARKFGYRVLEVPIHWSNDARTKVRPFRDGTRMFFDLWRVRFNDWSGKYTSMP